MTEAYNYSSTLPYIYLVFYNIIIKSANVDKGGGGKTLIHKMWIKFDFFKPFPDRCQVINTLTVSYMRKHESSHQSYFWVTKYPV